MMFMLTSAYVDQNVDEVYELTEEEIDDISSKKYIIVLGDINAVVEERM